MKRKIYTILLLFIASIVFYAGAGVTVVSLCYIDCLPSLFSEEKEPSSGCTISTSVSMNTCCVGEDDLDEDNFKSCCVAERISFDIEHRVEIPNISNHFLWTPLLDVDVAGVHLLCDDSTTQNCHSYLPSDSNHTLPREYLSQIRVLII